MGLGELQRTEGLGETIVVDPRVLTRIHQWWDVMQTTSLQVNRPPGWGFNGVTNGEIKNMKLWQVSVNTARLILLATESFLHLAHSLEL